MENYSGSFIFKCRFLLSYASVLIIGGDSVVYYYSQTL